ncbi:MAG: YebC/PmpR family DNA-binding transcriptional regulator [Cryobacterium sp.]|nr:YebC/PmpR family DNA-binding transcriptional regulator [Oligoflexia bacterium]
MGAQWKHAGRQANASKRGAIFGKLVKEIIVSARIGDPHPDNNSRLRAALESARRQSVPRDTIERAIKKGAGTLEGVNYETIVYEGFTPHQVPVIVECLTDNKNRTASDLRVLFRKGQLGSQGAVGWMFDRLGVIEATLPGTGVDIEGVAIESGAQNVEALEAEDVPAGSTGARFFCDPTDLDAVNKTLTAQGWIITLSEMSFLAKNKVELGDEQKKEAVEFLSDIDDHDDVHRIYTAL